MGYYVTTTAVNVIIPLDNEAAALAEMKRINGPEFDDHFPSACPWIDPWS